jgi:hypothetical protein
VTEWDETAWLVIGACALALATLVALLVTLRAVRAASRREQAARTDAAELRRRLDELERAVDQQDQQAAIEPVVVPSRTDQAEPAVVQPTVIEGRLFADLVLRESVVKAASWVHGVRRALSPENRNRIAFEMRREVKSSRKSRRAEMQEALRAYRARQGRGTESEDAA